MKTRTIRTLIVDDEPLARKTVRILLKDDDEIEIVGEAGDCPSAAAAILKSKPDLVFLDIQMPGGTGFDVVKAVGNAGELPAIVFVTAYDRFALDAFKVHAIDYLLKPFDDDQFEAVLRHVKQHIKRNSVSAMSESVAALLKQLDPAYFQNSRGGEKGPGYLTRFSIKSTGRTYFVPVSEVDWIEADGNYLILHTGPRTHVFRGTVQEMETRLDPKEFVRIHRSTVVRLDRVTEIQAFSLAESVVKLGNGTVLKVSRNLLKKLKSALDRS